MDSNTSKHLESSTDVLLRLGLSVKKQHEIFLENCVVKRCYRQVVKNEMRYSPIAKMNRVCRLYLKNDLKLEIVVRELLEDNVFHIDEVVDEAWHCPFKLAQEKLGYDLPLILLHKLNQYIIDLHPDLDRMQTERIFEDEEISLTTYLYSREDLEKVERTINDFCLINRVCLY